MAWPKQKQKLCTFRSKPLKKSLRGLWNIEQTKFDPSLSPVLQDGVMIIVGGLNCMVIPDDSS